MINLLLIPITALASYLHGKDAVGKGYLVAFLAVVAASIGIITFQSTIGLLLGLLSPLYWFLFRTGRQAKAELDYNYFVEGATLADIAKAYALPFGFTAVFVLVGAVVTGQYLPLLWMLPCILSLWAILHVARHNRLPFTTPDRAKRERELRSRVEIVTGAVCGLHLAVIASAAGAIYAAY